MYIIMLGGPGSGKGSVGGKISEDLKLPHIATGDIFRAELKNETELGKKIKKYMDNGLLVPDEVVIEIVENRLSQDDAKNGAVLDGFPRTENQAQALDTALEKMDTKLDKVINIEVDKSILVGRAVGRRICKNCGATYHIEFNKPKQEGICDLCQGELFQRSDDTEETVSKRIEVYLNETQPLIDYYTKKDILVTIDGQQDINKVLEDIVSALGSEK